MAEQYFRRLLPLELIEWKSLKIIFIITLSGTELRNYVRKPYDKPSSGSLLIHHFSHDMYNLEDFLGLLYQLNKAEAVSHFLRRSIAFKALEIFKIILWSFKKYRSGHEGLSFPLFYYCFVSISLIKLFSVKQQVCPRIIGFLPVVA